MKFIVVTGGVLSGLGKGISTSSIGVLLKSKGISVTPVKIDPYLNCDAGTMNPYQHGEVFRLLLLPDLLEAALDLVGDVGDDLHGLPQVVAVALPLDHAEVHLPRGDVVVPREVH